MNLLKKLFYLFLPLFGGGIVGFIMKDAIDYTTLNKPLLSPPSIIFPIAWTIIYLLIGTAYLIYRKNNNNKETIKVYYIQLLLNFLWSIIFFNLKWRLFSIIWIILLIVAVIILMKKFKIEEKNSYYLFIPYLLWLLFATYLNIGVYLLN
ncbi:MAG: tryptophan-rich sensory protein [Bacilli bacterium]|nr:tryptophan-rich sensory protein [Bacilli bacterium]